MSGLLKNRKVLIGILAGVVVFGLINLALLTYFLIYPENELPDLSIFKVNEKTPPAKTESKKPLVNPPVVTSVLPKGKILFQDDFSQVKSGWPRKESSTGLMDYVLDSYHLLVKEPNYFIWATIGKSFADVIIEVDARVGSVAGGDAGIICRYRSPENFYQFVVANDGYFGVYKLKNNQKTFVGMNQMRFSPAINTFNSTNSLRAECIGSRLKFYANGVLLIDVLDLDFVVGDVGISAGSYNLGGVDVQFDNFVVMQP